jgi:hypothetical protein
MTFNDLEQVETGGMDDTPLDTFLDNKSSGDIYVSFKDKKHSMHILRRWHYVRACVQNQWYSHG